MVGGSQPRSIRRAGSDPAPTTRGLLPSGDYGTPPILDDPVVVPLRLYRCSSPSPLHNLRHELTLGPRRGHRPLGRKRLGPQAQLCQEALYLYISRSLPPHLQPLACEFTAQRDGPQPTVAPHRVPDPDCPLESSLTSLEWCQRVSVIVPKPLFAF